MSDQGRTLLCPYTEITHEPHGDCPGFAGRTPSPGDGHIYIARRGGDGSCLSCGEQPHDALRGRGLSLPCGCSYTPGIDLPTTECATHAADNTLAHREVAERVSSCTGDFDCTTIPHIHGCYGDYGGCDHPEEHERFTEAEGLHLNPSLDMP